MNYKTTNTIIVTIVSVLAIIASTSFLGKDKVFAQSNLFDDSNGLNFGNFLKDFGNVLDKPGIPSSKTSGAPIVSDNPFTKLFGNTPSSSSSEKNSPIFIDKSCHPGSCLGDKGFYTMQGHHHCFQGTRDCVQTSHYKR
ncbi:MAG: hypothetical protein ABJB76_06240 [Candidatus Nitrosocosmicus sp.]